MTLPGYTVAQTRREVGAMIAGGRPKWDIANPSATLWMTKPRPQSIS